MSTFHYHIFRTIDFEGTRILILKHTSEINFTIAELEFDYREYEWQWFGAYTETEYQMFIEFIETVFAFDTRSFTIKLLDTSTLPHDFDLQGPLEKDYTNDAGYMDDLKMNNDVQDHMWSLWRAAGETIQNPW